MAFKIDLDRGVHQRIDLGTGMDIYMYVDTPGVYLTLHGTEVDVELARRAGFPVEEQLKKRRVQQALVAAQDRVLAELQVADQSVKVVVKEADGFKIIDIGYDRYQVLSPDDDVLTPSPLNLRSAVILLGQLVPGFVVPEVGEETIPEEKTPPKV